jgi:hypothetical protein
MRWKIILVNGGIVLVLSLLSFFLVRSSLTAAVVSPSEQRKELVQAMQAANAQLSVDALRLERWLAAQSSRSNISSVFSAGTQSARSDAATSEANALRDMAVAAPEFANLAPSLVVLTDADGVGIGRNGSALMRGDPIGAAYPTFLAAIKEGRSGNALWVNPQRQEQMLVAFAPVRDGTSIVGAAILGVPLSDDALRRVSELTSGKALSIVAGSDAAPVAATATIDIKSASKAIQAAQQGGVGYLETSDKVLAALPLSVAGSGAILVGEISTTKLQNLDSYLWPLLAVGALGLLLVAVGGVLLGNYISKPIEEVEEGLLMIMNGQQDLRFDLEHEELGGLTTRINALLNTILGVPEEPSSPEN